MCIMPYKIPLKTSAHILVEGCISLLFFFPLVFLRKRRLHRCVFSRLLKVGHGYVFLSQLFSQKCHELVKILIQLFFLLRLVCGQNANASATSYISIFKCTGFRWKLMGNRSSFYTVWPYQLTSPDLNAKYLRLNITYGYDQVGFFHNDQAIGQSF